jgi:alpha-beta hydrolase superfamily lysophospholipase
VSVNIDVLGEPYSAETIEFPDDDEGPVVATLVHRPADVPTTKAVLHVHGFADYFFQTGYAEWWNARGYDFYAIDLRKYGRSIRRHQTPNYVSDLREYFPDLDEAWARVVDRDEHTRVVLSAHSTGGLVLSLWANERGERLAGLSGMVLNSPWLDLQGSAMMRTVVTAVIKVICRVN